jgi:hypothetical protein
MAMTTTTTTRNGVLHRYRSRTNTYQRSLIARCGRVVLSNSANRRIGRQAHVAQKVGQVHLRKVLVAKLDYSLMNRTRASQSVGRSVGRWSVSETVLASVGP